MKRSEYNDFRKVDYKPEDWVDMDESWDERDSHCTKCYMNEPHTWLEHDRSIDHLRNVRRIA
jgi:hypothetical protein